MEYKGLHLDKFQEQAIAAIEENKSVIVSAPTGSGKTLIADYIIDRDLRKGLQVVYTAPIKALSNQKYKEFCKDYGADKIGLLTGDVAKNSSAPVLIMTTEIYRNMVLADDPAIRDVTYVVFDEIHYINDVERGYVWEESIIFSPPHIRMLCLSATIPNADEFAKWIAKIKGHEVAVVQHTERPVPLHASFYDTELGITTLAKFREFAEIPEYGHSMGRRRARPRYVKPPSHLDLIRQIKDKLPCIFFTFSRAGCQQNAKELAARKWLEPQAAISSYVRKKLEGAPAGVNQLESTKLLRQILPFGIGFHHAGLLPIMKEIVEELFAQGLIKVLYTTETFAVGINMPAKTVCIESLRKFDGATFRPMNSKEYFQMAGRAGRRGIDTEGFVFVMIDRKEFDYAKIKKVVTADTEPIKSQFRLSINTVLNLVKRHNAKGSDEILGKNFDAFQKHGKDLIQKKTENHYHFEKYCEKLTKLGYISERRLTEKGEFASQIYSDEILIGELFATDFHKQLNTYQILLLIAAVCYEGRERTQFHHRFPSQDAHRLQHLLRTHHYAQKDKRFEEVIDITAIAQPCYSGQNLFDIVKNTSLQEGDIIRLLRQVLDKLRQARTATKDHKLASALHECQQRVISCLKDVDVV
ncbi:DEAD/DEAH box helicase [Candidatus Woesearchaeota archaeon]|nr:DEAD/DEAH box helicase [Candidatus Woesearchaeota archaeon]